MRFWISAYLLKPLWNTHSTYFTQKSDSLAKKNYVTIFFVRLVDRTLFSWPLVNGRVKLENNDITGNLIGLTTFNDYASYSDTVIAVTCSFQCYWQDYSLWFWNWKTSIPSGHFFWPKNPFLAARVHKSYERRACAQCFLKHRHWVLSYWQKCLKLQRFGLSSWIWHIMLHIIWHIFQNQFSALKPWAQACGYEYNGPYKHKVIFLSYT